MEEKMEITIENVRALLSDDERKYLFNLVVSLAPENCLEVGTAYGGSAWIISQALNKSSPDGKLYSVDLNSNPDKDILEAVKHNTIFIKGKSHDILTKQLWNVVKFDFAFIDGDHSFEGCYNDIIDTLPLMKSGSTILLHDVRHEPIWKAISAAFYKYDRILTLDYAVRSVKLLEWGDFIAMNIK